MSETAQKADQPMSGNAEIDDQTRRDFLLWSTVAVGAAGTALAVWPFIDQMNPAADTLALASIEVDFVCYRSWSKHHCHMAWQAGLYPASLQKKKSPRPKASQSRTFRTLKTTLIGFKNPNGSSWLAFVRTWDVSRLVKKAVTQRVSLAAGSAHAMARTMIHPDGFVRDLHPQT